MTAIIVNNRALTRETQIYRAHILEISIDPLMIYIRGMFLKRKKLIL